MPSNSFTLCFSRFTVLFSTVGDLRQTSSISECDPVLLGSTCLRSWEGSVSWTVTLFYTPWGSTTIDKSSVVLPSGHIKLLCCLFILPFCFLCKSRVYCGVMNCSLYSFPQFPPGRLTPPSGCLFIIYKYQNSKLQNSADLL